MNGWLWATTAAVAILAFLAIGRLAAAAILFVYALLAWGFIQNLMGLIGGLRHDRRDPEEDAYEEEERSD